MVDPLSEGSIGRKPDRLKKRADFVRASAGRKAHSALFTVQCVAGLEPARAARAGFTVTKKVGNAVERNRIKRRLREVVRLEGGLVFKHTHDYVVVARRAVLGAPTPALAAGLKSALRKLHAPIAPRSGRDALPHSHSDPASGAARHPV